MLKKFNYKDVVWLDLEAPTAEELAQLGTDYKIHPLILAELAQPSLRTKVDVYNDSIYLILHFPLPHRESDAAPSERDYQEVDFILGENFIITAHYEMVNPLNDFAKIFENNFTPKKGADKLHAGFIFFYILREFYASLEADLRYLNDQLKRVEHKVFSGRERDVVEVLAVINREILDCRWSLKSHHEILESLELPGTELFGEKFRYYFRSLAGEHEKLWNMIESIRDTFTDLRDTNDSLLAIKTNDIMRVLTVAAFIFLPLTIVPQIFGMNIMVPFTAHPAGFVIVLGLMALASSVLYLIARFKKWF